MNLDKLASEIWSKVTNNKSNSVHPMKDWKDHAIKISNSLESRNYDQAKHEVRHALGIYPNQINLLVIATIVFRASGDLEKSLEYSELLITHHPDNWNGYGRSAQNLFALTKVQSSRFYDITESHQKIQTGLERLNYHPNLLKIAADIFRASGHREKSLEYSELLVTHHPDRWQGYVYSAQDLFALKRLNEAQENVQKGLEKLPNQFNLLKIAADIFRASGNRERSLEYSELLVTHHPDKWHGYAYSAQDLFALKRTNEAQQKISTGLRKFPEEVKLIKISERIQRQAN